MMHPVVPDWRANLLSPSGKPVVFSPLCSLGHSISISPRESKFVRQTSGCSTQVPEEEEEEDEVHRIQSIDEDDEVCEEFMLDPLPLLLDVPLLQSDLGRWAQSEIEADVPLIESDLGRWAQSEICAGVPLLQSALGRWAQAEVEAEERLEMEFCATPSRSSSWKEFLVDNSTFGADTVGLAYRRSKHSWDRDHTIPGPKWGATVAGVDEQDGWIRVGSHFLPIQLGGTIVLTPYAAPLRDGPALTAAGVALDLEMGAPIFFSHDRAASEGEARKQMAKAEHKMIRAARLAHLACEAEARLELGMTGPLAIDAHGSIRCGAVRRGDDSSVQAAAALKRLFRRRQLRRRPAAADSPVDANAALCSGPDGKVFLFLTVRGAADERREHVRRKLGLLGTIHEEEHGSELLAVDPQGAVHI